MFQHRPDQVLESCANSLLLEWYHGLLRELSCAICGLLGRISSRVSYSVGISSLMPSLLTWDYAGVQKEEHGRQRPYAGDRVNCDQHGLGNLDKLEPRRFCWCCRSGFLTSSAIGEGEAASSQLLESNLEVLE